MDDACNAAEHRFEGVGATAEQQLEPLAPLIDYYRREMGELPGRLMIATSFLGDAQMMPGFAAQSPEVHRAIEQAQALVVSVMVRLLHADAGSVDHDGLRADLERLMAQHPDSDHAAT
ncbi:MAG: hypothetical protein NVS4B8_03800 [Herpetosiphon sp.]